MDVVLVPDFEGRKRRYFQNTTNLFLASWLEHGSHTTHNRLHVVCIGEPPTSTVRLIERARASLVVKRPVPGPDRFRNKLRGFEINPSRYKLMLLDTDIVLWGRIDEIANLVRSNDIAAGFANDAHLSLAQWLTVYDGLGMDMPADRVSMLNAQFAGGWGNPMHSREASRTLPYFNGGVVVAAWASGLGEQWRRLIDEIPAMLDGEKPLHPFAVLDQPALAVAVDICCRRGVAFGVLPHVAHARWQHFYLGLIDADEALLVHNVGMFNGQEAADVRAGIRAYGARLRARAAQIDKRGQSRGSLRMNAYVDKLEAYLLMLHAKWLVA
ncbi:MAG: hypothetical protein F4Y26_16685 [Gammaproteobacteria bacterium]|nr:hypothetical protein [Gammaproteobacteria bacterium]